MDEFQKEIERKLLSNERKVLNDLKKAYAKALADIKKKIRNLQLKINVLQNSLTDGTLINESLVQSKIYQLEYQKILEKQINAALEVLKEDVVINTNLFLDKMYEDGYLGIFYILQEQDIPVLAPIEAELMVKTINKKTQELKFSERLYERIDKLKSEVKSEITRGIANSSSYFEIGKMISQKGEANLKQAYRIARTEGHRVSTEAKVDGMHKAKENGADIVKQWNSVLDSHTRITHQELDGQIKEVDEPFECSAGNPMHPSGFGKADQDINCRCVLLTRPRWAVEDAKEDIRRDNITGQLIEAKSYNEWKEKYYSYGLGTAGNNFLQNHKPPILLQTISKIDDKTVNAVLKSYEKTIKDDKIENAIVITKAGEIYRCFGNSTNVYPDYDLGDKLVGAFVTHNHPKEETSYSFSREDIKLFEKYNLGALRGIDDKYVYELNRNKSNVLKMPKDFDAEYGFEHLNAIDYAIKNNIYYNRWGDDNE